MGFFSCFSLGVFCLFVVIVVFSLLGCFCDGLVLFLFFYKAFSTLMLHRPKHMLVNKIWAQAFLMRIPPLLITIWTFQLENSPPC